MTPEHLADAIVRAGLAWIATGQVVGMLVVLETVTSTPFEGKV